MTRSDCVLSESEPPEEKHSLILLLHGCALQCFSCCDSRRCACGLLLEL